MRDWTYKKWWCFFLVYCVAIFLGTQPTMANDDSCQSALSFYRMYLSAADTWHPKSLNEFREKTGAYLTPSCIDETWRSLQDNEGDGNPIINGQDWSPSWRQHLNATLIKSTKNGSICRITIDPTIEWNQTVTVKVSKEGGRFYISEFLPSDNAVITSTADSTQDPPAPSLDSYYAMTDTSPLNIRYSLPLFSLILIALAGLFVVCRQTWFTNRMVIYPVIVAVLYILFGN